MIFVVFCSKLVSAVHKFSIYILPERTFLGMNERKKRVSAFLKEYSWMPSHVVENIRDKSALHRVIIAGLFVILATVIGFSYHSINKKIDGLDEGLSKNSDLINNLKNSFDVNKNEIISKISVLRRELQDIGIKLTNLDGQTFFGKAVLYSNGEPAGHRPSEKVCALSTSYPWKCDRETLRRYTGKEVFISIKNSNNSLNFKVIGFFWGGREEDGRMIQIPEASLTQLIGKKNVKKVINEGVISSKVTFPIR